MAIGLGPYIFSPLLMLVSGLSIVTGLGPYISRYYIIRAQPPPHCCLELFEMDTFQAALPVLPKSPLASRYYYYHS